jgi:hypothetical protein
LQELQRKREEKRDEVKQKAEQEIAFLQANGKIKKTGLGNLLPINLRTGINRNIVEVVQSEISVQSDQTQYDLLPNLYSLTLIYCL